MSFLSRMLAASNSVPMTVEQYGSVLGLAPTNSGVSITPDTALKISTVWACVRLIAETIASLPLIVYRVLPDGSRERATNHPLYDLLHDQPNHYQTAFEFREMMTGHALLRGNGYAKIEAGARGPADQLIPLHPDRVHVEMLQSPDPAPRYRYRVDDLGTFNDADILHVRGLSSDGILGLDPVTYARESFGLTTAGERYGSRFFKNDARPSVVLKHPGKLKPNTADRIRAHWEAIHGGAGVHRTAVLEEGMDLVTVGVEPRNAQFLELREFQAEDVCRWFRVPPHMVGLTSKATSWGSGIEQMSIGFVVYTLVPWLKRWEQAISRDLIIAPDIYFVEHLVDGLLRGDLKTRYEAYAIARDKGWYSVNDIRRKENENPIAGGDTYGTSTPPPVIGSPGAHHQELAREAAARVVRKEAAALTRAVKRGDDWPTAVSTFFADHAAFVAAALCVSPSLATEYVTAQVAECLAGGPEVLTAWEERHAGPLAALALEAA